MTGCVRKITGLFLALLILSVCFVLHVPSLVSADSLVNVLDIKFWSYPEYTRVVVTLSDNAGFATNRLKNPDRLYFDLKETRINPDLQKTLQISDGMLKAVRAGQFNETTARIVLDLEAIKEYKIFTLQDPQRIVIDIVGERGTDSVPEPTKKRIVLDPGHGGHDPGAVGPRNLYEKDVVLDIARALRDILSAIENVEVFLTRDKDVYLTLEERTAIANSKNADLFVSIHANASTRRDAKGIETYLLNWTNDEEAMKVAARENDISLKKMKQMQSGMDIVEIIKSDLLRENKRDESIKLAHHIQRSLVSGLSSNYSHIIDHGVKQALFYVLFGAQMPSVLVEVSFISNPLEEKLLAQSRYRMELAYSMAQGITHYMTATPAGQTVARVNSPDTP